MFLAIEDSTAELSKNQEEYEYRPMVELDMQLTFAQYSIGAFAFFGSFIFLFFCGTGLIAIPVDYILSYIDRPKPMDEMRFKKEKENLVKQIEFVLQ